MASTVAGASVPFLAVPADAVKLDSAATSGKSPYRIVDGSLDALAYSVAALLNDSEQLRKQKCVVIDAQVIRKTFSMVACEARDPSVQSFCAAWNKVGFETESSDDEESGLLSSGVSLDSGTEADAASGKSCFFKLHCDPLTDPADFYAAQAAASRENGTVLAAFPANCTQSQQCAQKPGAPSQGEAQVVMLAVDKSMKSSKECIHVVKLLQGQANPASTLSVKEGLWQQQCLEAFALSVREVKVQDDSKDCVKEVQKDGEKQTGKESAIPKQDQNQVQQLEDSAATDSKETSTMSSSRIESLSNFWTIDALKYWKDCLLPAKVMPEDKLERRMKLIERRLSAGLENFKQEDPSAPQWIIAVVKAPKGSLPKLLPIESCLATGARELGSSSSSNPSSQASDKKRAERSNVWRVLDKAMDAHYKATQDHPDFVKKTLKMLVNSAGPTLQKEALETYATELFPQASDKAQVIRKEVEGLAGQQKGVWFFDEEMGLLKQYGTFVRSRKLAQLLAKDRPIMNQLAEDTACMLARRLSANEQHKQQRQQQELLSEEQQKFQTQLQAWMLFAASEKGLHIYLSDLSVPGSSGYERLRVNLKGISPQCQNSAG